MNKAVIGGLIVLLIAVAPSLAGTIDVGTHWLNANQADQVITISLVPGDPVERVAGFNILAQIADGGPQMGGSILGPTLTGYDLMNETIWGVSANETVPEIFPGGQGLVGAVALGGAAGSTVAGDGVVAKLIVNTTGWTEGEWDLKLVNTVGGDSEVVGSGATPPPIVPTTFINGRIIVPVPEPATLIMLLGVLAAVPLAFWKKRS